MPAAIITDINEFALKVMRNAERDEAGCLATLGWRQRGYAGCIVPARLAEETGLPKGKTNAHRVIAYWKYGRLPPPGEECRHLCGRGKQGCIDPRHLAYGPRWKNIRDTVRHGRQGLQKLTLEQAAEVRKRVANGGKQRLLAGEFGVSEATVSRIVNGHSHVVDKEAWPGYPVGHDCRR